MYEERFLGEPASEIEAVKCDKSSARSKKKILIYPAFPKHWKFVHFSASVV